MIVSRNNTDMATPLKGNKLYPDITSSLFLSGTKRKGGVESNEKENVDTSHTTTKKLKVQRFMNSFRGAGFYWSWLFFNDVFMYTNICANFV